MGKIAKKHQTVEDAILYFVGIHGIYVNNSHKCSPYDTSFLVNLGRQIKAGKTLTDKQGAAALKVLQKYHRQLTDAGFDIDNIVKEKWFSNKPIDTPDKSDKKVYISKAYIHSASPGIDIIVFQLAYDRKMIKELERLETGAKEYFKIGWSRDLQGIVWKLTGESALIAYDFANKYSFACDQTLQDIVDYINENRQDNVQSSIGIEGNTISLQTGDTFLIELLDKKYNNSLSGK